MENALLSFFKNHKDTFYNIDEIQKTLGLDNGLLSEILSKYEQQNILTKYNDTYCFLSKNCIIRELQTTKKGNKYILIDDEHRMYIHKNDLNGALDFDTVVVEQVITGDEDFKGVVKKIISRKNPNVVCEVKNINGIKNLILYNLSNEIKFRIEQESLKNFVDGDRIVISLSPKQVEGFYSAKVVKHLCHKDDPDKEIKSIAESKSFYIDFNQSTLDEVNTIPDKVLETDFENRIDLRSKNIFTIDGEHTKDIDDAISLEMLPNGNFELGVHIAHVSHYVKRGGAIFEEARDRGTSAYLLDYVIPMIHHTLSNGICSLNPNEDRLARSCIMEINQNGEIVNYKIFKSVIRSKKKMTYEAVNKILEEDIIPEGYHEYADTIKNMGNLSSILTQMREKQGSLNFVSDEIYVNLDDNGKAVNFNLVNHGLGEKLIENFMIITNETIASHVFWQNLPFIYRIHECPTEQVLNNTLKLISDLGHKVNTIKDCSNPKVLQAVIKNLEIHEKFPILSNLLLRSMKRARYDVCNIGHFGLASNMYTHFTSPIRRFPDLMIHSLLDEYESIYENENFNENDLKIRLTNLESYLKSVCAHSSYKERQADLAEAEANKFKMLEYMKQYIGQDFEATILMINQSEVTIKTDNLITGKAKIEDIFGDRFIFDSEKCKLIGKNTREQYKIGHRIFVTVKDVVPSEKEIYFYINENISHCKILKKRINN